MTDLDKKIEMIGSLVGFILLIISGIIIVYWSDNKDKYYTNHPDFIPGTFILIGIFILLPLLIYASIIFIQGLWVIGNEIRLSQSSESSQNN